MDAWVAMFDVYEEAYTRRERFAVLNDSTRMRGAPSAAIRRRIAELAKAHEEQSGRWVVHSATVVTNPVFRGVLTALNWLSPPVYRQTVHGERQGAVAALIRSLEEEGIPLSRALRSYRDAS